MLRAVLFVTDWRTLIIRQISSAAHTFFDLKLWTVRSLLYRRRLFKSHARWKALDAIYKLHILLVTILNFQFFQTFQSQTFRKKICRNFRQIFDEWTHQFVILGDEFLLVSILEHHPPGRTIREHCGEPLWMEKLNSTWACRFLPLSSNSEINPMSRRP